MVTLTCHFLCVNLLQDDLVNSEDKSTDNAELGTLTLSPIAEMNESILIDSCISEEQIDGHQNILGLYSK